MNESNNLFDRLNEEARQDLLVDAQRSRSRFLQLSGIVLKELLESQLTAIENTERGEELDLWVTREIGVAPTAFAGIGRTCLAFMLEGRSVLSRERERLRILVPVPDNFNQDDPEAIMALPEPDEVYTERITPPRSPDAAPTIERYAVTRDRSFPYDLDESPLDDIGEDVMELLQSPSVPNELPIVIQLRLDMVRFKRHAQLRTVMGEYPVEEL